MTTAAVDAPCDALAELGALCRRLERFEEGGKTYFLLVDLVLPDGCSPPTIDALLCPEGRDGYPSRLLFAARLHSRTSPNWTSEVRIIERSWHAYSWKLDRTDLHLAQLVANHLRALR